MAGNTDLPVLSTATEQPFVKSRWNQIGEAVTEALSVLFFRNRFAHIVKLILPMALLVGLFILPLVFVFRISFWEYDNLNFIRRFTLENYQYFLGHPVYQRTIWQSVQLSLLVSVICFILGYPLALILTQARSRLNSFTAFVLITPLFISVVIRSFGWLVLLEVQGLVNVTLQQMGLIDQPVQFLNRMTGVVIDLVNVCLVFMVFPIMASLAGIPKSLGEAARTLGANPLRVWWRITLPLSAPGVLAGFVLVFALAISAYVQPRILGGARYQVIPLQIWREVLGVLNWPLGAAMGFTMLVISMAITALAYFIYRTIFPHVTKVQHG